MRPTRDCPSLRGLGEFQRLRLAACRAWHSSACCRLRSRAAACIAWFSRSCIGESPQLGRPSANTASLFVDRPGGGAPSEVVPVTSSLMNGVNKCNGGFSPTLRLLHSGCPTLLSHRRVGQSTVSPYAAFFICDCICFMKSRILAICPGERFS